MKLFTNLNQSIRVDFELLKSNQLDLWQFVLNRKIDINEKFCSPFRNDRNPGCRLYVVGEYIRLSDYGDPMRHQKTVFQIIQLERNCSFNDGLVYLSNKVRLEPTKITNNIIKNYKEKFHIKSFPYRNKNNIFYPEEHKLYWSQYGIVPQQLLQDYVFPVRAFQAGKSSYISTVIPKDVTFSYYFKDSRHQKVYRPTRDDKYKWITNCNEYDIGFWHKQDFSKNYLIITKSYKDARILENLGYNVIWVQSESTYLPDVYIKSLSKNYDKIFVLFDNDEEGIGWVVKHHERYNTVSNSLKFVPIWYDIDLPKDTGDIYSKKGKDVVIQELKNMI